MDRKCGSLNWQQEYLSSSYSMVQTLHEQMRVDQVLLDLSDAFVRTCFGARAIQNVDDAATGFGDSTLIMH